MSNVIRINDVGVGENPYTSEQFEIDLAAANEAEPLVLEIHSNGGDVTEGFKIFSKLQAWTGKKVARVQVKAFSIASYIAMACDEIEIAENGYFMIHKPRTSLMDADDTKLTSQANFVSDIGEKMVKAYSDRTGIDATTIEGMMRDETFISASQAISIGMADRIIGRAEVEPDLNVTSHLPALVVASMYGTQGASSPPAATPKEKTVSETQTTVTASVKAIKAAFPKASTDFIVLCMEKEMAMEDVGEEYAKAMEEENEMLKAKLTAMEEELEALKAMEPGEEPEPTPMEATGSAPVANTGTGTPTANPKAEFESLVESFVAKGHSRTKAVLAANRQNPTLRQQVVAQANGTIS